MIEAEREGTEGTESARLSVIKGRGGDAGGERVICGRVR
jgi:hypothetical protein